MAETLLQQIEELEALWAAADKGPWELKVEPVQCRTSLTSGLSERIAARAAFGNLCIKAVNNLPALLQAARLYAQSIKGEADRQIPTKSGVE